MKGVEGAERGVEGRREVLLLLRDAEDAKVPGDVGGDGRAHVLLGVRAHVLDVGVARVEGELAASNPEQDVVDERRHLVDAPDDGERLLDEGAEVDGDAGLRELHGELEVVVHVRRELLRRADRDGHRHRRVEHELVDHEAPLAKLELARRRRVRGLVAQVGDEAVRVALGLEHVDHLALVARSTQGHEAEQEVERLHARGGVLLVHLYPHVGDGGVHVVRGAVASAQLGVRGDDEVDRRWAVFNDVQ